jgi:hypothetical protein
MPDPQPSYRKSPAPVPSEDEFYVYLSDGRPIPRMAGTVNPTKPGPQACNAGITRGYAGHPTPEQLVVFADVLPLLERLDDAEATLIELAE